MRPQRVVTARGSTTSELDEIREPRTTAERLSTPEHLARGPVARFVRRRPLLSFFLWFFTIGQAIVFTPVLARLLGGAELASEPFLVAGAFLGLLLPAVLVTWVSEGTAGLRVLRRRSFAVRGVAAR